MFLGNQFLQSHHQKCKWREWHNERPLSITAVKHTAKNNLLNTRCQTHFQDTQILKKKKIEKQVKQCFQKKRTISPCASRFPAPETILFNRNKTNLPSRSGQSKTCPVCFTLFLQIIEFLFFSFLSFPQSLPHSVYYLHSLPFFVRW